jgi:hypothetical protein
MAEHDLAGSEFAPEQRAGNGLESDQRRNRERNGDGGDPSAHMYIYGSLYISIHSRRTLALEISAVCIFKSDYMPLSIC